MMCAMCDREVTETTRHHLIPRTRHGSKRTRKTFTREAVRETVELCRACHKQIHALFTEKELAREYYGLDRLRAHPDMEKFLAWIRKQPAGRRSKTRRKRR